MPWDSLKLSIFETRATLPLGIFSDFNMTTGSTHEVGL